MKTLAWTQRKRCVSDITKMEYLENALVGTRSYLQPVYWSRRMRNSLLFIWCTINIFYWTFWFIVLLWIFYELSCILDEPAGRINWNKTSKNAWYCKPERLMSNLLSNYYISSASLTRREKRSRERERRSTCSRRGLSGDNCYLDYKQASNRHAIMLRNSN